MSFIAVHVRRAVAAFVILAPLGIADAQVALQVKSGTTWTSSIELRAVAPVTFRWRWDGAELMTGVAWQLATSSPTSTATTRVNDAIAGETAMRLPAAGDVKGGSYTEFIVNPPRAAEKFWVRVRVNTGKSTAFSRWIEVNVVERAAVAQNPTCTVDAFKYRPGLIFDPAKMVQIVQGELVDDDEWPEQRVVVRVKNRLTAPVSYRLKLNFASGTDPMDPTRMVREVADGFLDPSKVQTTAASGTETLKFYLMDSYSFDDNKLASVKPPKGVLRFEASTTPISGSASTCSIVFTVK